MMYQAEILAICADVHATPHWSIDGYPDGEAVETILIMHRFINIDAKTGTRSHQRVWMPIHSRNEWEEQKARFVWLEEHGYVAYPDQSASTNDSPPVQ